MRFLFEVYSWITCLGFFLLDVLPVLLRKCVLKSILGKWGGGLIDRKLYIRYPRRVYIGKNCAINRGCKFYASAHTSDNKNIVIGDHVVIGPNVTIFSAGHNPATIDLKDNYGRVTIDNDVWIGGNTTILQGVTIHQGAVVGAGSIVTKDVPAWTIVAGNPARVIKKREIITNNEE